MELLMWGGALSGVFGLGVAVDYILRTQQDAKVGTPSASHNKQIMPICPWCLGNGRMYTDIRQLLNERCPFCRGTGKSA